MYLGVNWFQLLNNLIESSHALVNFLFSLLQIPLLSTTIPNPLIWWRRRKRREREETYLEEGGREELAVLNNKRKDQASRGIKTCTTKPHYTMFKDDHS